MAAREKVWLSDCDFPWKKNIISCIHLPRGELSHWYLAGIHRLGSIHKQRNEDENLEVKVIVSERGAKSKRTKKQKGARMGPDAVPCPLPAMWVALLTADTYTCYFRFALHLELSCPARVTKFGGLGVLQHLSEFTLSGVWFSSGVHPRVGIGFCEPKYMVTH
jgi:hypothetical protein